MKVEEPPKKEEPQPEVKPAEEPKKEPEEAPKENVEVKNEDKPLEVLNDIIAPEKKE